MTSSKDPKPRGAKQREALAESEKKAAEQQPQSYDERNVTDKKVRVEPTDPKSSNKAINLSLTMAPILRYPPARFLLPHM